jgi:hypothetical protein
MSGVRGAWCIHETLPDALEMARGPLRRIRKIFRIPENNSLPVRNCFLLHATIRHIESESNYLFESRKN